MPKKTVHQPWWFQYKKCYHRRSNGVRYQRPQRRRWRKSFHKKKRYLRKSNEDQHSRRRRLPIIYENFNRINVHILAALTPHHRRFLEDSIRRRQSHSYKYSIGRKQNIAEAINSNIKDYKEEDEEYHYHRRILHQITPEEVI